MVQLEDVIGQTQKHPLYLNLDRTAEQKSSEAHVLFGHGKNALGLDAAVYADELTLFGVDPFFHFSPLAGKALGNIDNLAAFLKCLLTPADANALLFQRTIGAIFTAVDRGLQLKAVLRLVFLQAIKGDGFPVGTGVGVRLDIINHVFPAADVRAVFLRLSLLMVGGFHKQKDTLDALKVAIVFFTLIPQIHTDILDRIPF